MARHVTRNVFGRNVKKLRVAQGLTQEALGDRVGTDKGHISRIESGQITPTLPTARAIANALSASLDALSRSNNHQPA